MGFSNRVRFKSVIQENQSKCFAVFGKLAPRRLRDTLAPVVIWRLCWGLKAKTRAAARDRFSSTGKTQPQKANYSSAD